MSNVVRLPTAAPRKVRQPSIRAVRAARAAAPWPWDWRPPHVRDGERTMAGVGRSPELLIALAMLKHLTPEQRRAVQDEVHRVHFAVGDDASLAASAILSMIR